MKIKLNFTVFWPCLVLACLTSCSTASSKAGALNRASLVDDVSPPPTRADDLVHSLTKLASFGQKAVGSPAGYEAAKWILQEMKDIGLEAAHFEEFAFPYNEYESSKLVLVSGKLQREIPFEILEGSGGTGGKTLNSALVWVNIGAPADFVGKDLTGKIAVLRRDVNYDRSIQLQNCIQAHAVAMLYVSQAPNNLRQVGTVRRTFEPSQAIPAISIGKDDGEAMIADLQAGKKITAAVRVQVKMSPMNQPGHGRNVISKITGEDPSRSIVISAHYDTWFTGSSDNSSGISGLLALARRELARVRLEGKKPRYTLVFAAFDGEEISLYGGYAYLRRHFFIPQPDKILAAVNLEMPTGADKKSQEQFPEAAQSNWGLIYSQIPVISDAVKKISSRNPEPLYPKLQGIDAVAKDSGGVIATDIQPHYRAGIPTICTWLDTPWYHTAKDDLEHIDIDFLAKGVDFFGELLVELAAHDPVEFAAVDTSLLKATATVQPRRATSEDLTVTVAITDVSGKPVNDVPLQVELHVNDFFPAWTESSGRLRTDRSGIVHFSIPASAANLAPNGRYLNITAGAKYPLVEAVVPVTGI